MTPLNVGGLMLNSRANGPGLRAVVWVQGCRIRCPGCVNRHFWSHAPRFLVDPLQLLARMLKAAPAIEGISVSGGEPFEQPTACKALLEAARQAGLSTLVFTGSTREVLEAAGVEGIDDMLEQIDILIDGPFIAAQAGDSLWRGSSNQRIHFLTDRYDATVLDTTGAPREEILFNPSTGCMTRTGIVTHP